MQLRGEVERPRHTHHRDTPPEVRSSRQGRSPGSQVAALVGLPGAGGTSGINRRKLTAYSCGGSAGIAFSRTGFPLSFRAIARPKDP